jgi:hypothetical protein
VYSVLLVYCNTGAPLYHLKSPHITGSPSVIDSVLHPLWDDLLNRHVSPLGQALMLLRVFRPMGRLLHLRPSAGWAPKLPCVPRSEADSHATTSPRTRGLTPPHPSACGAGSQATTCPRTWVDSHVATCS